MSAGRGWLVTILCGLGAGALAFGLAPGRWPNPLRDGTTLAPDDLRELAAAAGAVEAACARGDVEGYAAATTAAHRQRLQRQLAVVDGVLDGGTLRALGSAHGRIDWLQQPLLAGHVHGTRVAIAVARPEGDGCQLLAFVWDGRRLQFDGSRHLPAVRSPAAAAAAVADAVRSTDR